MKIVALSVAVPKNKLGQVELEEKFGVKQAKRLSVVTGIKERHVATNDVRALELILQAAEAAIAKAGDSREFNAIFLITQTSEYKFPATACIIQDKLGISKNTLAYDINLGCSGFTYGLVTANAFIESKLFKRILLIVGDLTNSTASKEDISTYTLFGDAYSAAIIEASDTNEILAIDYGTDGSGAENLITYIGGSRYPNDNEYRKADGYNLNKNVKFPGYVYMDGAKVFEFSIDVVPEMLNNLLKRSGHELNDLDYFFFHQANTFMLKHFCTKLNIDLEKTPMVLEEYGNTSGASIPLTICSHFGNNNSDQKVLSALIGFGVGYSWAGVIIELNPSIVVDVIEV